MYVMSIRDADLGIESTPCCVCFEQPLFARGAVDGFAQ